jgi:hypothetical protein
MHSLLFQVSSPFFAAYQSKKSSSSPCSPGSQQVNGIYRRPWEITIDTEENFTLTVEVV